MFIHEIDISTYIYICIHINSSLYIYNMHKAGVCPWNKTIYTPYHSAKSSLIFQNDLKPSLHIYNSHNKF